MAGIEQTINEIADEFALLPDWEERIAHVIELARALAPLREDERNDSTRVRGCASQVWLVSERLPAAPEKLQFRGDSDAHLADEIRCGEAAEDAEELVPATEG